MKFISDFLWSEIKILFPSKEGAVGRPEADPRQTLEGIIFIIKTGCQWKYLPRDYGPPSTVHGKFMKWCKLGIFDQVMKIAREYYRKRNSKNNWFAFDTSTKKAPIALFGGKNPTDRGKIGIKYTLLVDRKGAPLFVNVAAANIHDSQLLDPVIEKMRKSKRIRIIATDSAFYVKRLYNRCKIKNFALVASPNPRRKKNVHKFKVPYRWIVEQTFGILSWFRGIKICWAKTLESSLGFHQIACSLRLFKMSGIFG